MTRKDYVRIADAVKENIMYNPANPKDISALICLEDLIQSLCNMLKIDNPRFDAKRFKEYINK